MTTEQNDILLRVRSDISDAKRGLSDLDNALLKLIQSEKREATNKEAVEKFKQLTQSEKDAIVASAQLSEQSGRTAKAVAEVGTKGKLSLTDLKSGIDLAKQAVGTMGQVFTETFRIGEEGGAIIQTQKSFDGLIDKLGLSKDLLQQLNSAAAGTIDKNKLMSSTMTLLAGTSQELGQQLGNATPELLEIAKAANKLNPSLGDTAFLYDSIATGVKRASPLILDNLGLTIKIGEANQAYADKLGKTVQQLTASEQKTALLNATLAAGKTLIEQAGGASGSATDFIQRMNAALTNAGNSIKAFFAPAIASAADSISTLLTAQETYNQVLNKHNQDMKIDSASYSDYVNEMKRAAGVIQQRIDQEGNLTDRMGHVIQAHLVATEAEYNQTRAINTLQKASDKAGSSLDFIRPIGIIIGKLLTGRISSSRPRPNLPRSWRKPSKIWLTNL